MTELAREQMKDVALTLAVILIALEVIRAAIFLTEELFRR